MTHKFTAEISIVNGALGEPGDRILVDANWDGPVDRPSAWCWSIGLNTPRNMALAKRLKHAVDAGVVNSNPAIRTDVNGKTFVAANCCVMGRRMNADLKRLGY